MKRWFALVATLCLMLSAALAEETPLGTLMPLVDKAADEAMAPENGGRYCGVRPMAVDASETGDAVRILGDLYLAEGQLETLTDQQYAQVEWLDRRAVAELRLGAEGWAVVSFALDAEWEMEDAAQEYFASAMVEYVNTDMGFAIQYPAAFGENAVTVTDNGIAGKIEGASFSAFCMPNEQGWTTETLLAGKKQETSATETNIDTITGLGCLKVQAEGLEVIIMMLVTQTHVYEAELRYDQELIREFALYGEYMIHSFTIDEMGNG